MRRAAWLVLALAMFGGCKDAGRERFLAAKAQYVELVEKGTHPRDPAFNPVREKLQSVPKDSKAYDDAQALLRALDEGRNLPGKPLATVPESDSPLEQACADLARRLGEADGGDRDRLMEALSRCREKLEREKAHTHPENDPHDH